MSQEGGSPPPETPEVVAPSNTTASRLSELKKKLMAKKTSSAPESPAEPVVVPSQSPLPVPERRPMSRLTSPRDGSVTPSEPLRLSVGGSGADKAATSASAAKQPLTMRSLMGGRMTRSASLGSAAGDASAAAATASVPAEGKPTISTGGSRLKEAPAHRAAAAVVESKTNLIRSKVVSLNTRSVTPDNSAGVFPKDTPIPTLSQLISGNSAVEATMHAVSQGGRTLHPFAQVAPREEVVPSKRPNPTTLAVSSNYDVSSFIAERRLWLAKRKRMAEGVLALVDSIGTGEDVPSFIEKHKKFLRKYIR